MINWEENRVGPGVKCKIRIRETCNGMRKKPGIDTINGMVFSLIALWKMDEDDGYPGEYALSTIDDTFYHDTGITWIASGDVEVMEEI